MSGFFLKTIHKAASVGWVYDSIQTLVGVRFLETHLRRRLSGRKGRVLDIGGGTGTLSGLLPPACTYTCLDNEMPKLQRCAKKARGGTLMGDATRMPIRSESIDAVTAIFISHHLTDDQLDEMLRETARVMKPAGSLILMDPVWKPSRLPGRLLWAMDRGSWPRTGVELHAALERHFRVDQWDHLAIYHAYILGVCRKKISS